MAKMSIFTSLLFLLQFSSSYSTFAAPHKWSSSSSSPDIGMKKQREFDYFMLALQWPGTFCQGTSYCCPTNGCCLKSGPLAEFTIHGLWPDYNDGTWPSCCSDDEFDIKKVASLLAQIQKYWPSLSCGSSSLCHGGKGLFWAHEWGKHGTCSSPVIKDEHSYFSTVLDLYFKYNMTKILNDAGFQASKSANYPVRDVVNAIKEAFGATPQLICSHGNIEELRLCFYKDFKPRDCDVGVSIRGGLQKGSCPKKISLPIYDSPASVGEDARIEWAPVGEAFHDPIQII